MNSILVFFCVVIVCGIYFFRRKNIDALLLGFVSSLTYFMPGFIGEINFSYGSDLGDYASTIVPKTYIVMIVVLLVLTTVTVAYDRISLKDGVRFNVFSQRLPEAFLTITLIGMAVSICTIGKGYLCIEKQDVLERIDVWYYVAAYSAPLAVISALSIRKRWIAAVSMLVLLADLFIGFRTGVSIALVAACLVFGQSIYADKRKRNIFILSIVCAAAGLFIVKQLAWNIKYTVSVSCEKLPSAKRSFSGRIQPVGPIDVHFSQFAYLSKLLGNSEIYRLAFSYSEPMVTQSILNEVIKEDFRTPRQYLYDQMLSGVPGGKSIFGIDVSNVQSFNAMFQPILFPRATFGMASNPWAQAYAAGSFGILILFAAGYAGILALSACIMSRTDGALRGGIAVLIGWWGFYFHRNDLLTEIGIMKMVVYIFLVSLLVSVLAGLIRYKKISKCEQN